MIVKIEQKLIKRIVKTFRKHRRRFKIGVMLGERLHKEVVIKDFIYPNQTHSKKGEVAKISSTDYSNIINKYGKKVIGFIFYMRTYEYACDTEENKKIREKCSAFGMIDLSLSINAKGKHSFYSNEWLDVDVK